MLHSDAGLKALERLRREKRLAKMKRLTEGSPKWKDEKYMDMKKIEEYGDHLMDAQPDDTKVMAVCLRFIEVKDKIEHGESDITFGKIKRSDKTD